MNRSHPRPEVLEKFLRGEASQAEGARVVLHLLGGCPACLDTAQKVWTLADLPWDQIAQAARGIRPRLKRPESRSDCHYKGMRDVQ